MDPLPFLGPLRPDGDTLNNGNNRVYTLDIFLFQKTPVIEGSRRGGGFCPLAHALLSIRIVQICLLIACVVEEMLLLKSAK